MRPDFAAVEVTGQRRMLHYTVTYALLTERNRTTKDDEANNQRRRRVRVEPLGRVDLPDDKRGDDDADIW